MTLPSHCWKCGTPQYDLTPRGAEYLRLLADPAELTTTQIGARLKLARPTVKNGLSHLYKVLGVKGRVGAIRRAIDLGIVEVDRLA